MPDLLNPNPAPIIPGLGAPARQAAQDAATARAQQAAATARQTQEAQASAAQAAHVQQQNQNQESAQTAAGDAVNWAMTPEYAGKSFADAPPEARQHFVDAYGNIAGEAPSIWNQAQRDVTGIPGIGVNLEPGQTAQSKVAGSNVLVGKPERAEKAPREQVETAPDGSKTIVNLDTGTSRPIDFGGATAASGLNPGDQETIDKIASYNAPPPWMRGGYPPAQKARLSAALAAMHPEYDAKEYQARQAALTGFKEGPEAKAITSANTVIGHLSSLNDSANKLGNYSILPGITNPVENFIGGITNPNTQAHLADFNSKANAVASELGKLFTGNAPTLESIRSWRSTLSPNMAPEAMKQSIQSAVDLIASRLSSLQDQWDKGVKNPRDIPFLNTQSRAKLRALGQDPDALDQVGQTPSASTAPAPASPQIDRIALAKQALTDPAASPEHKAAAKAILGIP